jgi:hypothetical protein
MHHVPQLGLTALAVAGPVERGVRPHSRQTGELLLNRACSRAAEQLPQERCDSRFGELDRELKVLALAAAEGYRHNADERFIQLKCLLAIRDSGGRAVARYPRSHLMVEICLASHHEARTVAGGCARALLLWHCRAAAGKTEHGDA